VSLNPNIVSVDPRTDPRWRALACRDAASLFTSPPWLAAVSATYDFVPQARVELLPDGAAGAGVAWVDVNDLRGPRRLTLPFSDRGDPVVSNLASWQALTHDVGIDTVPFTVRTLDGSVLAADDRLELVGEAAWHRTPLDSSADDLWKRLSTNARHNVNAGLRNGVKVEIRDDLDAVREFHQLHTQLRKRKYALLAQPRAFFERIWEAFAATDDVRVLLATSPEGDTIAGGMYLTWNGVLYYKFGASLAEHLLLRPNELVTWTAMQFGLERRLRALDWGLSDLDQPGLVAYKRKWATEERRIHTYRNTTAQQPANQKEVGALLHSVTELFTDSSVPDNVTEQAGALLYRYFC
jgi:CelD/BcsL family acetyltransferase involved in cellulose biosynthesis